VHEGNFRRASDGGGERYSFQGLTNFNSGIFLPADEGRAPAVNNKPDVARPAVDRGRGGAKQKAENKSRRSEIRKLKAEGVPAYWPSHFLILGNDFPV
jgi:hypothetical protein